MKGIVKKVNLKEYKTKDGRTFKKFNFEVDVEMPNGDIKSRKGSYSEDFAKRYFGYCKVKAKDLVGKEVSVALGKKMIEVEGEKRSYEYIRFLNCLDKDGNSIIMPSTNETEIDF